MPCEGEKAICVFTSLDGASKPSPANTFAWHRKHTDTPIWWEQIIGWRYADAEQPDPYAKYRQALQEGKTVQVLTMKGEWMDWRGDEDFSPRHPKNLRIKPDETPWIEWRGGHCPLKDEEVEEWEYKLRGGAIYTYRQPESLRWTHRQPTPNLDDIISYRVLKWRKQEPKKQLGPEDVPPGSVIKASDIIQAQVLRVNKESVYILGQRGTPYEVEFEELQKDWQINRSIPLTGKWNPGAWEACEK
jgi:hypothetical protein